MTSRNREYGSLSAHQKSTVGDTKMSVVGLDHMGWLLCDGRLLNVSDYYFLFSIIQYSFGGSGLQFKLPNPAGRVAGVIGNGGVLVNGGISATLTARLLGADLGAETHTLTIPQMPTHRHTGTTDSTTVTLNNPTHTHTGQTNDTVDTPESETVTKDGIGGRAEVSGSYQRRLGFTTDATATNVTANPHLHTFTSDNTGGSQSHNNMQPTLFMGNMFIYSGKLNSGTFPNTSYNYGVFPPTKITSTPQTYSKTLIL